MYKVGDRIRVKESAFGDTEESVDIEARGQHGKIVTVLEAMINASWSDCYEVHTDNGIITLVTEDEIEPEA